MISIIRSPLRQCEVALAEALQRSSPHVWLDDAGYVSDIQSNLIEGVHLRDFEHDLRQGNGNELGSKFRAAHSSSALAVNTFAPFKVNPTALSIDESCVFSKLTFERKCPNGMGTTPPNLDVFLEGGSGITAIESKCLEPLRVHVADISQTYFKRIKGRQRDSLWFAEMQKLQSTPRSYRWLDAAQLVKHAMGLAFTFPRQSVRLIYMYWEPSNASDQSIFVEHREEIARFAKAVSGDPIAFATLTYRDLWARWQADNGQGWLRAHATRLRARYDVACVSELRHVVLPTDISDSSKSSSRLGVGLSGSGCARPDRPFPSFTQHAVRPSPAASPAPAIIEMDGAPPRLLNLPTDPANVLALDLLAIKNSLRTAAKAELTELMLDADTLACAYATLVCQAPRRARPYLSATRNGVTSSGAVSNRQEEHLAVALFNTGAIERPDGRVVQIVDYQFPLKAVQTDRGIGKVDLLGIGDDGAIVVIEIKVGDSREDPRVGLIEALIYSAAIEANLEAVASELETRLRRPVLRRRPDMLLTAPRRFWDASASPALLDMVNLASNLSAQLNVAVEPFCLDAELASYGLQGAKPQISGRARFQILPQRYEKL